MNISEERFQAECYQWFHNSFPELRGLLWHVPNGGQRSASEANKFKAIGLVPGVSDLHFFYHGKIYFIELKTETGRLSENQVKWIESISSQGAEVAVIRDLQTFQNYINAILSPKEAI
jgi:hypothetical protein